MMKVKIVLCGVLAGIVLQGYAWAEMFRWVDEQGRVHYSDSPPQGQALSEVESIATPTYDYRPKEVRDANVAEATATKEASPPRGAGGIEWMEHDRGLNLARLKTKPAIIVLYAEWCPACKRYWKTFDDESVVAESSKFVMIRVDVDKEPELSKKYRLDGGYVPKTIAVYPDGRIMEQIYPDEKYKYSIGTGVANVLDLMQTVSDTAKKA